MPFEPPAIPAPLFVANIHWFLALPGQSYYMLSSIQIRRHLFAIIAAVCVLSAKLAAQSFLAEKEREMIESSTNRWWYTMAFVVTVLAVGAFVIWRRRAKGGSDPEFGYESRYQPTKTISDDREGLDLEEELEWFRKAKKISTRKADKPDLSPLAVAGRDRRIRRRPIEMEASGVAGDDLEMSTKLFQEKMKRLQFSQLPIHSFLQLTVARTFEQLPLSADPALLSAIEQTNEEFEEDEAVRELALRILAAFKTRNSVEALTQIALYDLSSNLRSKAVATLTDFDHESVFEALLLACADPTREVRAAAARGLFRLSFDRAEAWKRLIATKDEFRMVHAARAAIESGIVQKSFDRLLHEDMRIAYEAVALIGVLMKAGETDMIFDAIRDHADERVKYALLHVIKIVRDERTTARLAELLSRNVLPADIAERAAAIVKEAEAVAV